MIGGLVRTSVRIPCGICSGSLGFEFKSGYGYLGLIAPPGHWVSFSRVVSVANIQTRMPCSVQFSETVNRAMATLLS